MTIKTTWQSKAFSELSLNQLYDVLKLRIDVFVVEQTCYYPDLDSEKNLLDRHPQTLHLLGYQAEQLVAYLRILPKGQSYTSHISIGRVVIANKARGGGLGHELMKEALSLCQQYHPNEEIKISAQQHLKSYYQRHGFAQVSAMYLEDGIPHIAMLRES
ncbi:GCN5 family acetyltransferase [Colwellia sp. MT41]|uniref:ElaA protein n=1 Tax=Colwellia marinimaniae TaxID=1513592 RepID=A0ABQ0MVU1_9GAMM|nr:MULTISPECIES: GNAT family N-acetyltransferase [Colwellia]ALO35631.1 GCN5 family acetyltransferase [Colwellia sp. MT41]GAW96478.1 ElaA protein [Colwellia marinimaniae]